MRGVDVLELNPDGRQNFSTKLVKEGSEQGWLRVDGKTLTVFANNREDVRFNILREPGRYCCHCGEKLQDDDNTNMPGELARQHVAAEHPGAASPDPNNPGGYECIRHYECEEVQ